VADALRQLSNQQAGGCGQAHVGELRALQPQEAAVRRLLEKLPSSGAGVAAW